MPEMKIQFDSYDAIKPLITLKDSKYQRNKHPKEQIERLAKIMRDHGVRHPIHISNRSGNICFGHGRKAAAQLNGWSEYPVVYQSFASDEEEYACVQSDNAIASWAELDLSEINKDLEWLGPDFDIDLLGIKDFEIEPADKYKDKEDTEDDVPEVPEEPKAKLGDLYQLGRHRLLCGDSAKKEDIDRLMNGEKADMLYCDPPYGMNLDTDFSKMPLIEKVKKETGIKNQNTYKKVIGDDKPYNAELLLKIFETTKEIFLWGADYYIKTLSKYGSWLVWDKRCDENFDKAIGSAFELCWSKFPHKRQIARIRWIGAFGTETQDIKKRIHPTQKPIQLAEWFFERWGKGLTNIVDLYGGSGSTLIACQKTNRRCFMCEIDPHYTDVIIKRYEDYTGDKAVLLNG